MSLDNWICRSDVQNGIRCGDIDLAVTILAGAISYIYIRLQPTLA